MPKSLLVPTSPGELIDKISILEIKRERIADKAKVANVERELVVLQQARQECVETGLELLDLHKRLREVNEQLWEIEDAIRACERNKDFGQTFIELARSVYITNDRRAALKREINELCGSLLVEEKSYQPY